MLPLVVEAGPGPQHETQRAVSRVEKGMLPEKLAGGKGYRTHERERMPEPSDFGREVYRRRTVVGRLKEWRRIGTQFEKRAVNFAAMVRLACIRLYPAR